jgi:hypothetical protein
MNKYIAIASLVIPSLVSAQEAPNWYDIPQPTIQVQGDAFGNQNYITSYPNGSVVVSGVNQYNGATWSSQADSRGASGVNAQGLYWANNNSVSPIERNLIQNVQSTSQSIATILFAPR